MYTWHSKYVMCVCSYSVYSYGVCPHDVCVCKACVSVWFTVKVCTVAIYIVMNNVWGNIL